MQSMKQRWMNLGRQTLALLACVLFTVQASAGWAAAEPARQRAEVLIKEGLQLARAGEFRAAIPKFEEANRIYPHSETQHNLARAYEELKEFDKAYDYYTLALQQDYAFAADGRARLANTERELRKTQARLTVRTTPRTATVVLRFADGRTSKHVATPLQVWAPAGVVVVTASDPSFQVAEQRVQVAAGADPEVALTLVPLRRRGYLQVQVNRPGAEVKVAGRSLGKAPLETASLDEGVYDVEVSLADYTSATETVTIKPDTVTRLNVTLHPLAGSPAEIGMTGVPAWVGWTLVGVGTAALGTATYLQFGEAMPRERDARQKYKIDKNVMAYSRAYKAAERYQNAALGTAIAGGVLAVTGAALLIWYPEEPAGGAAVTMLPGLFVSDDGAMVTGTFTF